MPTLQKPIGSGFGAASTAGDVIKGIELSGRVAIVTGGYSGVGLETTRALRFAGAKVIVPARDRDKAATALKGSRVSRSRRWICSTQPRSMPSPTGILPPASRCTSW